MKGLVAIVSQEPIVPSVEVDTEPGALGLQVHTTEDPLRGKVHAKGCALSKYGLIAVEEDHSLNTSDRGVLPKEHNAHQIIN